jgi:hypothetical protein
LWLNIKQRYLSNMAFKDYEEIVDKCCFRCYSDTWIFTHTIFKNKLN